MTEQQRQQIVEAALAAREMAYAPYSAFRVGAAVMTASGKIHVGCNVENASFGLTLCAERVALATAVASGDVQFVALAVASDGGAMPCGACRQFAAEFRSDLPILAVNASQSGCVVESNLSELLPKQFEFRQQK